MPFGLTNELVVFQHLMNDVFNEYLGNFVVCYINDILNFSKNTEDLECHICLVLEKLREVEIYVKLKKCEFHQSEVEFLGFIIFGYNIHMDLCKFQTIVEWVTPTSIQDVQCFFGFANFY
jgi:hypothetical protein